MVTNRSIPFTFSALDDIAFAATRGRLPKDLLPDRAYFLEDIGPGLEMAQLAAAGLLPPPSRAPWLSFAELSPLWVALRGGLRNWRCPTKHMGFQQLMAKPPEDPMAGTAFKIEAHKAALAVGLPSAVAAQLVGALEEMQSNVYDHSGSSSTGIALYRATVRRFEFVITDRGIGAMQSLRLCPEYTNLDDPAEALRMALTEGVSRYGSGTDHGKGFRPLFIGLANLNGSLRFRSDTGMLTLDGENPAAITPRLATRAAVNGFFAAIICSW
jgi:anti-sigma regulatory factor (Ser/Thr protein kinase)